jgi:hypothetical protein
MPVKSLSSVDHLVVAVLDAKVAAAEQCDLTHVVLFFFELLDVIAVSI